MKIYKPRSSRLYTRQESTNPLTKEKIKLQNTKTNNVSDLLGKKKKKQIKKNRKEKGQRRYITQKLTKRKN